MAVVQKTTTEGGIPHELYDLDAVRAADKAIKEGKTVDEAAEIARQIIWKKKGYKSPKKTKRAPAPEQAPVQEPQQSEPAPAAEDAALRRYLIAVCRAAYGGRGYFEETMTTRELLDCASVLDIPVKAYVEEQWQ